MVTTLLYLIFSIVYHHWNYHRYEQYDNLYNFVFLLINIIYFDILMCFYQSMICIMVVVLNKSLFCKIYYNDKIMLRGNLYYLVINLMNKRNMRDLYFILLLDELERYLGMFLVFLDDFSFFILIIKVIYQFLLCSIMVFVNIDHFIELVRIFVKGVVFDARNYMDLRENYGCHKMYL